MKPASIPRAAALAVLALAALGAVAQGTFKADPAKLLADAPTSGAITMLPGEVYVGPGPMTVGYLGAKKQIVLPQGTWLLLAVGDRPSTHAKPMPVVYMVFGRFDGSRLVSLLRYHFNGRPGALGNTWTDYTRCAQDASLDGRKLMRSQGIFSLCGYVGRWAQAPALDDAVWQRARAALDGLGVPLPAGPVIQTLVTSVDSRADMLALQRIEFTDGESATRLPWLARYADLMLGGMDRRLDADELEPGKAPAGQTLSLPD